MERIRYKYRKAKKGIELNEIKCPVCGNPSINWAKSVGSIDYNGKIKLLAECWSGDTSQDKPKHLFLIILEDLPVVEVCRITKDLINKEKEENKLTKRRER